jgi:membrane fusion protein, copper/silver efflux system
MTERNQNPLDEKESQAAPTPEEIESNAPGAGRSNKGRKTLLVAAALLVAAGLGIYLGWNQIRRIWMGKAQGANTAQAHGEAYYCPMHPDFKSDKPDNCPVCSMKLVKLEKPGGAGGKQAMTGMPGLEVGSGGAGQSAPTANTIFIDPQRRQLIGVRSEPATVRPLVKEIRALGKVAYDETKVTHIHTKISGYIEQVFVDYVGKVVKSGDPLFTIYSPDLVATQEEYLLALRARRQFAESSFAGVSSRANSLLEAARSRLELWDITPAQINSIERDGKARRALTIYSPVGGIVTERAAYHHGRFVNPEMDLYTIVDLSTVWINGEVYEYELPLVKPGLNAEIEFPYDGGKRTLRGKVVYVYPYLEEKTRTAKIRFTFTNPNFVLKPDMFVNVKLKINLGNKLVVPEDAVLDTGTEQYVFVDKGNGYFEPRAVKHGPEAGGYYAVESGLEAGERVVTAANFILDSESRLKGAFANMGKPGEQGMGQAAQTALKIELMDPKAAHVGRNTVRLTVKDAQGNPVTDAEVEVTLFMPQMGGMAPMIAKAMLKSVGAGEYTGTIDIPMAWSWQTAVTVKKEGKSLGSMQATITAR